MGIKEKYAKNILSKRIKRMERTVILPDIDRIKKVGIIWQLSQKNAYKYLRKIFNEKQAIVRDFCIFEEENEPQVDNNTLTSKDLDWWGLPKAEKTEEFLQTPFDLLLNIALQQNLILDYFTALSQAGFKTGWSPDQNNHFDLNINIGEKADALYLAKQQIFYLAQLNKKSNQ